MRLARDTTTLVVVALAVLAGMGSTANAQTLELTNEATGNHCPAVTVTNHTASGGCAIHFVSDDVQFQSHNFGLEQYAGTCDNEFTARLDEVGHGYVTDVVVPGNCTTVPCLDESVPPLLPARIEEEDGGMVFSFTLCVREVSGYWLMCPVRTILTEPSIHNQHLTVSFGTRCSLVAESGPLVLFPYEVESGTWAGEADPAVEIQHL